MKGFPQLAEETAQRVARDLLDRAMRVTLHRLNGVRSVLAGWATLGVPQGQEAILRQRLEEDRALLSRLDWIRSLLRAGPRPEVLLSGEAPRVLLAASLGLGTPEEAAARLPRAADPRALLALALWAEAVRGDDSETVVGVRVGPDGLVASYREPAGDFPAEVLDGFEDLLLEPPSRLRIRFRPGCFEALLEGGEVTPFVGDGEAVA